MKHVIIFFMLISTILTGNTVLAQDNEGKVARAVFSSNIQDREPVDSIQQLGSETQQIFFFTELKNLQGQAVKHRWLRNGEQMAEVDFNVGGNRWRVWSSKQLIPGSEGEWKVEVVDGSGVVLGSNSIHYGGNSNNTSTTDSQTTDSETQTDTPQSEDLETTE